MAIDSLLHDLRYAARTLRRDAAFTGIAVAVLALGIGATASIFSLVSAVVLRPLPFAEPDRLVVLWENFSAVGGPTRVEPTPATYVEWRERARSFQDIAALVGLTFNLTGQGEPERVGAVRTTTNLFSLLGVRPILGRTFTDDDEGPDTVPVAVISDDLWIRRFGGDPQIVGRPIELDGLSRTIIGVVPADFRFPNQEVAVWVPASFTPQELAQRNAYYMYIVARLNIRTTLSEAQAELTAIAATRDAENAAAVGATVASLHEHLSRDARPTLFILLAAVGIVLLITCANVANLLLARGTERRKELALRKALGAADRRLLRQLLTESAVLAALGLVVGVALSTLSFEYLATFVPGTYPQGAAPELDWRVLSLCCSVALLTVLLVGAAPAFAAARLELTDALKKSVGPAGAVKGARVRNALVVGEITLTVALLTAAGLLLRSYAGVSAVDPGFPTQNLLIAETPLSPTQYRDAAARSAFQERVLERVAVLPGVSGAGYVNYPPLVFSGGRSLIALDGRPAPPPEESMRYITSDRVASVGYLSALGVPLLEGRHLDERDGPNAPLAVVINHTAARLHWPEESPIGGRLKRGGPQTDAPWYTVVGVVGDVRQAGLDVPPLPEMYFTFAQRAEDAPFNWPRHLVMRVQGDPMALAAAVRDAIWDVDPSQPVASIRTMDDVLDAQLMSRGTQLTLVGGFAALALLLASVGLYGVLSYMVAQRTSEIGVKMALGAERRDVVRSVLGSALALAAIGIVLGLAAALGLARLLASFLFGVSAADPATLAAVAALLLVVTVLASYVPARRAASVDPMAALRME